MQTVGEILRSEREKKELSIKDIELGTSIRTLYIKAIEENDFKVVPGEVYLKGFIRNYASYLGLDVQVIMDVYRQCQSPEIVTKAEKAEEVKFPPEEGAAKEFNRSEQLANKNTNYGKFASLLILVIAVGGAFWWFNDAGQTPKTPVKETKPAPTAPALPSQQESKTVVPPTQNKPVVVSAKFTANCWTLIMADGKEVYQGIPKAGETITWEAEKNIVVKVGNAGAIDLTYNGQNVGKLGGNGEVVEKTFTAKM